ncbi:MAG: putative HNHc nuclease [Carnobacterium sp.]|uniref:putative HNHc nuclease n=1 Tax=Carnobacterium sp. TaxID=48221 RepID=UPI003C773033
MEFQGKLKSYGSNHMTIEIPEGFDIEKIKRISENGDVMVDFYEKDTITDLQRKHYWALVGDIEAYTGYTSDVIDSALRVLFMKENNLDEYPSLKRNEMKKTVASELLEFVIDLSIKEGIPFRKQQFYLTIDISKMLYALTMKRLCWVCGKPHSDIHHANGSTIGMGNDRTKVNHIGRYVVCLCRLHHQEIHPAIEKEYFKKHHIAPIKLNRESVITLGLMSKKQVRELEEERVGTTQNVQQKNH